ncbi:hypothetical protein PIROE2DRAFT_14204 [Piromyces sp. E2]|nr:hypothetical protein PIROE2DRAFT_14204 [Piromyces sp. E2]|eukprot:OUM60115.1 hypothetical protein PIROE2DRAFT_14204 [Piromyces sp. E2]
MPSSITKRCVLDALSLGYRAVDTAQCYGNEREVGEVMKYSLLLSSGVVTDTLKSIETSLDTLDIKYIDLLLIHQPTGDYVELYRVMENFYHKGKIRAIGISNFYGDRYLKLVNNCTVKPQINQVETHVFRQLRELMKEYHTQLESCKKHGKSVAQVGLRFLYQQDIIIIPKSTHKERMAENQNILDFELSAEEMEEIRGIDEGEKFIWLVVNTYKKKY